MKDLLLLGLACNAPAGDAQTHLLGGDTMNTQTVLDFASAINEHDIDTLRSLMTDDHPFII